MISCRFRQQHSDWSCGCNIIRSSVCDCCCHSFSCDNEVSLPSLPHLHRARARARKQAIIVMTNAAMHTVSFERCMLCCRCRHRRKKFSPKSKDSILHKKNRSSSQNLPLTLSSKAAEAGKSSDLSMNKETDEQFYENTSFIGKFCVWS